MISSASLFPTTPATCLLLSLSFVFVITWRGCFKAILSFLVTSFGFTDTSRRKALWILVLSQILALLFSLLFKKIILSSLNCLDCNYEKQKSPQISYYFAENLSSFFKRMFSVVNFFLILLCQEMLLCLAGNRTMILKSFIFNTL